MLDKVVHLLTARERMAVVGSAQAVRTVTVPCYWQGPYRDTPGRPDGSKHRPGSVVDRSNTRHRRPVVTRVRPRAPRRHLFIITVVAGRDAAPLLEPVEAALDGVAQPVESGVERGRSTAGRSFGAVTTQTGYPSRRCRRPRPARRRPRCWCCWRRPRHWPPRLLSAHNDDEACRSTREHPPPAANTVRAAQDSQLLSN